MRQPLTLVAMSSPVQARSPRTTDVSGPIAASPMKDARRSSASVEHRKDLPLQSVRDGAAEYNELYQARRGRVLRLCRLLLSDADEADDVSQEVFLKLFRQHQLSGRTIAWGPWLTKVTVNACRDRRRSGWWKWWREHHQEFEETQHPARGSTPEQTVLGNEARRDVWLSFRQLSARQQEVFVLRQLEGWSAEAVAEALGLSPGSIKRHLYRAVHHMRRALRGQT
ncbi:MAG: sigma-70 family RNA polymerase sigma factor [Candidatus Binatia bacterium]|jgi:RNA polymerase sigma-70 factor (ECF subfamily)